MPILVESVPTRVVVPEFDPVPEEPVELPLALVPEFDPVPVEPVVLPAPVVPVVPLPVVVPVPVVVELPLPVEELEAFAAS
jgi:hypothetical protein